MVRSQYDGQLKELKSQVMQLGSMVEAAIQETINAFVNQDSDRAREIIRGDDKIDHQVRLIEHTGYSLLLRQSPVAGDLREVSAALKMITDMERIGDHAEDISELTLLMAGRAYSDKVCFVEEMAKEAMVMLIEAIDAYVGADCKKAEEVIAWDDRVDALFLRVKEGIKESIQGGTADAEQDLDLFLVAKYFERIGDHATNIAEWVLFSLTGRLPVEPPR